MGIYDLLAARPGGLRGLAAARLRYNVLAALHAAGLDVRRPGRLRVNRLAEMLHDASPRGSVPGPLGSVSSALTAPHLHAPTTIP